VAIPSSADPGAKASYRKARRGCAKDADGRKMLCVLCASMATLAAKRYFDDAHPKE
jgi:hypothetical protein